MHNPHTWHPCLSPDGKHTSYWVPEMGDHGELLPALGRLPLFCLFVFLALDLSTSAASTAVAIMSLLHFNLCWTILFFTSHKPGSRCKKTGARGGRKVRWHEVVDAVWWALYIPMGTEGAPHHISAQLGHSYLPTWREGIWSSSSFLLICSGSHIYPYLPPCSS